MFRTHNISIEELGLMEKALEPGGVPRRIGIINGSVMGTHHLVTFSLHGSIDYPILVEDQKKRGKELPTAMRIRTLNMAMLRLCEAFALSRFQSAEFHGGQHRNPRISGLALRAQRRHKIGLVTRVMASVHAAAS